MIPRLGAPGFPQWGAVCGRRRRSRCGERHTTRATAQTADEPGSGQLAVCRPRSYLLRHTPNQRRWSERGRRTGPTAVACQGRQAAYDRRRGKERLATVPGARAVPRTAPTHPTHPRLTPGTRASAADTDTRTNGETHTRARRASVRRPPRQLAFASGAWRTCCGTHCWCTACWGREGRGREAGGWRRRRECRARAHGGAVKCEEWTGLGAVRTPRGRASERPCSARVVGGVWRGRGSSISGRGLPADSTAPKRWDRLLREVCPWSGPVGKHRWTSRALQGGRCGGVSCATGL